MSHPDRARIEALAAGELAPAEASGLREHLLACPACRRHLTAGHPTALFALLGGYRPAPVDWSAFHERMRRDLRAEVPAAGARRAFGVAWWKPAAILAAAAGLLVAILVPVLSTREFEAGRASAEPATAATAGDPFVAGLETLEDWVPVVEGVESPTAEIYELASVDDGGVQLVLVVDEGLEL